MVEQWYYMHDGRQAGPVALEELKRLVESGQLRGADEVWKQGTPDWKPVRSVPELAASQREPDPGSSNTIPQKKKPCRCSAEPISDHAKEKGVCPGCAFPSAAIGVALTPSAVRRTM